MRTAVLVVGIALAAATFLAMCQAMLVPRRSTSLIVRTVNTVVTAVAKAPLRFFRSYRAQDRWLSGAAPLSVLAALVVYVMILIAALGLVVYGTTGLSLNDSFYQSGATLTTLGIVEPVTEASTITTFVAAFLGLVVIAIFIGYLMAVYGAYVTREAGMARAAMLAGEPAWGPMTLARGRRLGLPDAEVPDPAVWLDWLCTTRLNQQVNPVLMEFRSTSSRRHWVITMLALLDAAALRVSLSTSRPDPHQIQLLTEGAITLWALGGGTVPAGDLPAGVAVTAGHNWDLEHTILRAARGEIVEPLAGCGVTREDFEAALPLLLGDGGPAPEHAWTRFRVIRSAYYLPAAGLARRLHALPAPWSGPRTPALPVEYPEMPPAT